MLSRRGFTVSSRVQKDQSIVDILRSGKDEESLSVNGWVRSVRKQKRIAFAAIGDGSTTGSLQAVLKPEDAAKYVNLTNISKCTPLTYCLDYRMAQQSA